MVYAVGSGTQGMSDRPPRILFVTGRLAEFALRDVLKELEPAAGFESEIAVLPISVAALMPTDWIARKLEVPNEVDQVLLPGLCRGDLRPVIEASGGRPVERGPEDLRNLPSYFGQEPDDDREGGYQIEILAEINHAAQWPLEELLAEAERFRAEGADRIDVGCDPGGPWRGVGEVVTALRERGHRVSIDSFDPVEVESAIEAGADLVLSVNASNRDRAKDWGVEAVLIPDEPSGLGGLKESIEIFERAGTPYRLDPILEPIGFGFAASLGRYLEVRRRYPEAAMLMGVGNLTELTDADSAPINVLLAGFCEELNIQSVLTTAVIPWARTSVRELDLARRLAHRAVKRRTVPKHLEPRLVMLRDPKAPRYGGAALLELQRRIRDPNWRLFAEDGILYALNNTSFLKDSDPSALFDQMGVTDPEHAFYLGHELAKAKTALTLGKHYRQDQALDWGFLTEPEASAQERRKRERRSGEERS